MDLEWLAREAETDQADGLPPTVTDPTALRLLALGISQARKAEQAPVLPLGRSHPGSGTLVPSISTGPHGVPALVSPLDSYELSRSACTALSI